MKNYTLRFAQALLATIPSKARGKSQKSKLLVWPFWFCALFIVCNLFIVDWNLPRGFCQEEADEKNCVAEAWKVLSQKDYELLDSLVDECVKKYGEEADREQASLSDFPPQDKIDLYKSLNDVATCLFV